MIILIQGIFFHAEEEIKVEKEYLMDTTPIFFDKSMGNLRGNAFHGILRLDRLKSIGKSAGEGTICDYYGPSNITNVSLDMDGRKFCFEKQYTEKSAKFFYTFSDRIGDVWLGRFAYAGMKEGGGVSSCVLHIAHEHDNYLVNPHKIAKFLNLKKVYIPPLR